MNRLDYSLPKELLERLQNPKKPFIIEYTAFLLKEARKMNHERHFLTFLAIRSLTVSSYKINEPSFFRLTRPQLITLLEEYVDFGRFACSRREIIISIKKLEEVGLIEKNRANLYELLDWKSFYKKYRSCQKDDASTKEYNELCPSFRVGVTSKKYCLKSSEIIFQLEDLRYFFKRQAKRAKVSAQAKALAIDRTNPKAVKRSYRRFKLRDKYEARMALLAITPGKSMNISQQRLADEVFGLSRSATRKRLLELKRLGLISMTDCGSVLVENDELIASRHKFLIEKIESKENDPFGINLLSEEEKKELLVKASKPYYTFKKDGKVYRRIANLITHNLSSMAVVKNLAISLFLSLIY